MSHPCASKKPPAWCTRKKKGAKKSSCSCPSGYKRTGIMCFKGAASVKRATCKKR